MMNVPVLCLLRYVVFWQKIDKRPIKNEQVKFEDQLLSRLFMRLVDAFCIIRKFEIAAISYFYTNIAPYIMHIILLNDKTTRWQDVGIHIIFNCQQTNYLHLLFQAQANPFSQNVGGAHDASSFVKLILPYCLFYPVII